MPNASPRDYAIILRGKEGAGVLKHNPAQNVRITPHCDT